MNGTTSDSGRARHTIEIERAYGTAGRGPGPRVLVDRLWPRGIRKESLRLDAWMREVGPSDELRKWFGHRPERWGEFRRRYREELRAGARQRELLDELLGMARGGRLTLLYSAKDEEHNQAVVVRELLEERMRGGGHGGSDA
jgi:uncharacterized protein YeaO (DUF488 family)